MSLIQVLILLLILSANGIIIPNSAWYCLITWAIILFLQSIIETIKKNKKDLDKINEI